MIRRRTASVTGAGVVLALLLGVAPAAAWGGGDHHHRHHHRDAVVRLEGLSSPKALAVGGFFDLYVGQGFAGDPGPVLKYRTLWHGTREVTEPLSLVDIAIGRDGAKWLLGTDFELYRQSRWGKDIEPVRNIAEYQAGDPDPDDQDGNPIESNPFGLAALGRHHALVVDAAGNDLIRVGKDGSATTVARWTREEQRTAHLGPDSGLPPTIPAEAVPTTVAIGPDGYAYVGQLVGFPGTPGAAKIWRVNPWTEDAVCSLDPAVAKGCRPWKGGFTAIFDMAFNRWTGKLYVYELAREGFTAFEAGFQTGKFPDAVLLEVSRFGRHELAKGELSQPGGIVVTPFGRVFVTDGVFTNGRLLEIRR